MFLLCIGLPLYAFLIFLMWRILAKAGYSGALSLLLLIPFVGFVVQIILLCMLAFGEWPSQRQQTWNAPLYQPQPVQQMQPMQPMQPMYPQQYNPMPGYAPPPPQYYQQMPPQGQYYNPPQGTSYP